MNRVICTLVFLLVLSLGAKDKRPNILWLSAEDISSHFGCYGDEFAITPTIDTLAKEGILYSRAISTDIDETEILQLSKLAKITSVIKDLVFFAEEKWKISSDKGGSGNTANIGSIHFIEDILNGNGVFVHLGESIFDEYWINQGVLQVPNPKKNGDFKKLTSLTEFLDFKGMDKSLINFPKPKRKNKR